MYSCTHVGCGNFYLLIRDLTKKLTLIFRSQLRMYNISQGNMLHLCIHIHGIVNYFELIYHGIIITTVC